MNRLYRRQQAHAARVPTRRAPRSLLFTLLCLLAFSLQSYVAATHTHVSLGAGSGLRLGTTAAASADAKAPVSSDQKNAPTRENDCPLCRAVVHAGAFLFPSFLILELPGDGIVLARLAVVTQLVSGTVSHSWHSRGPPTH